MSRKAPLVLITPALAVLIAGAALSGCSDSYSNSDSSTEVPQSNANDHDHDHGHGDGQHTHDDDTDRSPDVYAGIRGEITQLPNPEVPGSELKIRHEQIRDFKTGDGTINVTKEGIAGMRSMTMPFPLGEGMSIDGFNIGDKVEFDFVVNWGNNRPAWEVTKIGKLPPETELDFTNVIEELDDAIDDAQGVMDHDHDHDDHSHDTGNDGP